MLQISFADLYTSEAMGPALVDHLVRADPAIEHSIEPVLAALIESERARRARVGRVSEAAVSDALATRLHDKRALFEGVFEAEMLSLVADERRWN
jgi:hypothetical protein